MGYVSPFSRPPWWMGPSSCKKCCCQKRCLKMDTTMGSPGSPTSHSQYLPGFLLGEPDISEDTRLPSSATPHSPPRTPSGYLHRGNPLTPFRPDYNRGSKTKIDGPPTQSLFDDLVEKPSMLNNTLQSPQQLDGSIQDNDGFWVVVFGFPPSQTSHVVAMFSQLGHVIEHSYPANGNWVFIKYQSRSGVRKALTYNERVISGNFMIGVNERRSIHQYFGLSSSCGMHQKYTSNPPHDSDDKFFTLKYSRPYPRFPTCLGGRCNTLKDTTNTSFQFNSSLPTSPVTPMSPKIRHLNLSRRDNMVVNPPVPTKDTSMVSKAMDLLFGW